MKYAFNEKDLFDLFMYADKALVPKYPKPYLKDGYVHATDGYKIIRIKADTLNGKYEPTDKMRLEWPDENCDYLTTDKEIEKALASVPQVEEEIKIGDDIDCPECDGTGKVYWEYTDRHFETHQSEFDCPVCGGDGYAEKARTKKTGRMIPEWTASVGFANSALRVDNVKALLEAMKIIGVTEVHLIAQIKNKNLFKIDDNISVMIMGYLRKTDYIIVKGDRK